MILGIVWPGFITNERNVFFYNILIILFLCIHVSFLVTANLGDLEEMSPSLGGSRRGSPISLYQESIASSVREYDNHHVYPYTCLAGYCYRNGLYKQALQAWAKAAAVIKQSVMNTNIHEFTPILIPDILRYLIPS